MNMTRIPRARSLILLVAVLLFGAACGQSEVVVPVDAVTASPTPVATTHPEPTAIPDGEPTAVPEPSATPEPTREHEQETSAEVDLAAAAAGQWRTAAIDSYVMTYVRTCFCPRIDFTVTVVDGQLVDVRHESEIDIDIDLGDAVTVDDMFDIIETARNQGAHKVTAEYHPTDGRPVSIYIDKDEMIADEEFGYEVLSFEPGTVLSQPEVETVPPPELETLCRSLSELESIDDKPTSASEAQATVTEMIRITQVIAEATPVEYAEGAMELVRFVERVSILAEQADWEPEFFDSLPETATAQLGVNLGLIEDFFNTFTTRCSES